MNNGLKANSFSEKTNKGVTAVTADPIGVGLLVIYSPGLHDVRVQGRHYPFVFSRQVGNIPQISLLQVPAPSPHPHKEYVVRPHPPYSEFFLHRRRLPKTQLTGAGGANDIACGAKRFFIMVSHEPRR